MLVVANNGTLCDVDHNGTSDGAFYRALWATAYGVVIPCSDAVTTETLRTYAAGNAFSL
jgi:hypothetical protein